VSKLSRSLRMTLVAFAAILSLLFSTANPSGATINTAVVNGCANGNWNWKARFGGTKSTPSSVFKSYSVYGTYQAYTTGSSFTYYAIDAPGFVIEWSGINQLGVRYYSEGGPVNCP
jgi:hypothetical protein